MNPANYITLVTAKRALGASWGAIAGMTGVSVPDLRKAFDPTWPKEFDAPRQTEARAPAPLVVVIPKATGKRGTVHRATSETLIGRILLAINAGHVTTSDIAKATGGDRAVVAVLLTRLKGSKLVSANGEHRSYVWSLTEAAEALLSGLPAPVEVAA